MNPPQIRQSFSSGPNQAWNQSPSRVLSSALAFGEDNVDDNGPTTAQFSIAGPIKHSAIPLAMDANSMMTQQQQCFLWPTAFFVSR